VTKQLAFAVPKDIVDVDEAAKKLAKILNLDEQIVLAKISDKDKKYVPLKHQLTPEEEDAVKAAKLAGIRLEPERVRFYPDKNFLSQVRGFALMLGGPKEQWPIIEPIIKTLSSGENYGLVGTHGAGHFVKMVHNGIEYGMMEAIGEGYAVLHASEFGLDLGQVTKIYQKGSVISSWLIDLTKNIFDHEDIDATSGKIDSTGEGEWTINAAKELGVDVRVIEDSYKVRQESINPENQNKFSNKIVALLRKQFGGHAIHK
jgi:hypothetical protein